MRCPRCGFGESRVVDSRPVDEGSAIRRRRECLECGYRFTTHERVVEADVLLVVKRDGRMEAFDREKLIRGMAKACEKLPVSSEVLERIAYEIESALRSQGLREVSSTAIGEMVMERLKEVHEVAYVRFASVYRQFTDLRGFLEEIGRLMREAGKGVKGRGDEAEGHVRGDN